MKRSREVTIMVEELVKNGLVKETDTDRTRAVIKEAFKKIRVERYEDYKTKNC